MRHSYLFPEFYSSWLSQRLPIAPRESLATCENCAMVNPSGITRDLGPFFGHLKCCTYFPYLPNFTLGALGEEQYQAAKKYGVFLPVGLYESLQAQGIRNSFGHQGFGREEKLLCPFFSKSQNSCSIWAQRPGVCTTYFCKSDYGQMGLEFWSKVEKYLNHFEWKMATELMTRMGLNENEIAYCQAVVSPETEEDERDYFIQAAWGKWFSKQREFYQESYKEALGITSSDLDKILDPQFLELEKSIFSQVSTMK